MNWQRLSALADHPAVGARAIFCERRAGRNPVAGERGTVLMVLKARSLPVSESQRARIGAYDDLATLKEWAEAALTAATAEDLFK